MRTLVTTRATRVPKYVYSRSSVGMLVHEVASMEVKWSELSGERLAMPSASIITKCGGLRHSGTSVLCNSVAPEAVRCLRCLGHVEPTVRHQWDAIGPSGLSRKEARDRLARLRMEAKTA